MVFYSEGLHLNDYGPMKFGRENRRLLNGGGYLFRYYHPLLSIVLENMQNCIILPHNILIIFIASFQIKG